MKSSILLDKFNPIMINIFDYHFTLKVKVLFKIYLLIRLNTNFHLIYLFLLF